MSYRITFCTKVIYCTSWKLCVKLIFPFSTRKSVSWIITVILLGQGVWVIAIWLCLSSFDFGKAHSKSPFHYHFKAKACFQLTADVFKLWTLTTRVLRRGQQPMVTASVWDSFVPDNCAEVPVPVSGFRYYWWLPPTLLHLITPNKLDKRALSHCLRHSNVVPRFRCRWAYQWVDFLEERDSIGEGISLLKQVRTLCQTLRDIHSHVTREQGRLIWGLIKV